MAAFISAHNVWWHGPGRPDPVRKSSIGLRAEDGGEDRCPLGEKQQLWKKLIPFTPASVPGEEPECAILAG